MPNQTLIKIDNVRKSYAGGFEALKGINLEINRGEILALLGPNGAGKTTLINAICGVVVPNSGTITVDGYDVVKDFRKTRSMMGLVPQELQLEAFGSRQRRGDEREALPARRPGRRLPAAAQHQERRRRRLRRRRAA